MAKRKVTPEDLFSLQFVGDVQISPDGKKALYVHTAVNGEKDGYFSSLWLTDFTDQGSRFTHPQPDRLVKDHSPRWSPDGQSIAFLSNRSGMDQVWLIPADGGDAKQLTELPTNVQSIAWSPDGKRLACLIQDVEDTSTTDVKVITKLRYKHDSKGFRGHHMNHIWVVEAASGEARQVTSGDWEDIDPVWSPDSRSIIFLSDRSETRDFNHVPALWKLDVETGECVKLVQCAGFTLAPRFSPDGKWIAYFDHQYGETNACNDEVWLIPAEGGEARNLTGMLDRSTANWVGSDVKWDAGVHQPTWSKDGRYLYFLVTEGGNCWIHRVEVKTGLIEPVVTGDRLVVTSFAMHDDGVEPFLVYVVAHPQSTGDLYVESLGRDREKRQLTDFNQQLFSELALSEPERIRFEGADGWEIEGWLLKPPNFQPDAKYPLILQIHGGPHTCYGFSLNHEFQMLASAGYVVLYTNPRGSQGYGKKFARAVLGDWGGKDYEDLMRAVDYACTLDYVDADQLFVSGGSYGGFMVNWIVGHTDRFKAAVTQRSICNLYSMAGSSDIGFYFIDTEFAGADLWEHEEFIMSRSPIRYARHVKTPVLIEHSENDLRCPMEQAEQWFIALKRLGVETVLVRTPDEGHELSRSGKPKHRIERLKHILNWFEKHRSQA
ncbi:S9 family peptidase [Brevibacillus fluminis]|uniref:S9 family peptidase n=1 Tax=Brevibacillus fluminis TaxID=511487 RepID=UPI003F8BFAC5